MFANTYQNRRVLVTEYTRFKRNWLALWFHLMGAKVSEVALPYDETILSEYLSSYLILGLDLLKDHKASTEWYQSWLRDRFAISTAQLHAYTQVTQKRGLAWAQGTAL